MYLDLVSLIVAAGYVGLFVIIFAETGLLIGVFLPGDSLLLTVGLVASKGIFDIRLLIPLLIVAAVAGDATGYYIGKQAGPMLFARDESRFFKRRHLLKAREFYDQHGGKTIFLARFLAFVRTFAPTVAGAVGMPYRQFSLYNVTGGVAWITSMTLGGYWLGDTLERLPVNPEIAIVFTVIVVIVVSVLPAVWHVWRERKSSMR